MALPTAYLMAAPEATGIFTRERLQSMTFETAEVAYKHLRVEAMRCGFTIATNQSKRSNYMTIHCGKGGRVRGNDTKKTGCPFRLYLTPREEDGRCVIRAECVEHNHPLTPDKYSIFTLAPDKQDLIRKMLDSGVAPNAIQRFLERSGETGVSTLQIRRLAGRDKAFQNRETEDLRRYMEDVGGVFKRMEIRLDEKCYVHAVFTAMDFEVENMRRFADVIWLDGTQRQNYLKWEIIPITLIDSFKRIRSGGMFFVSRGDQEILEWVLNVIKGNDEIRAKLKTIITDEDSAFIPAFKAVFPTDDSDDESDEESQVNHVLCAFHKEQNFVRKLMTCGLAGPEVEAAKDLFKIICYSGHREACDDAVANLKTLSPKLAKYVESSIEPLLPHFARSYLAGVFTKGYNTTSPAESHNNMIKSGMIDGRIYTLKQMRIDITATHRNAEICFREKITSSFVNTHFTWTQHSVMLSPRVREAIDLAIQRAADFSVCLENRTVLHPDAPKYSYKISDEGCSCGHQVHAGLPCVHLLAFIKKDTDSIEDNFPVDLIADCWRIADEESVLIPVGRDGQVIDDHEEGDEVETAVEELVFPAGNPLDEEQTSGFGERDLITALTDKDRFLQQKERYLVLFHLAKSVASISSRHPDVAEKVRTDLTDMLHSLLGLPETTAGASQAASADEEGGGDEGDEEGGDDRGGDDEGGRDRRARREVEEVDVQDVVRRGRGRPKKQATVAEMFKGRRECVLCGRRHSIVECDNYEEFRAAVEHNLSIETGTSRCGICKGIGHNRSTCGWYFKNKK